MSDTIYRVTIVMPLLDRCKTLSHLIITRVWQLDTIDDIKRLFVDALVQLYNPRDFILRRGECMISYRVNKRFNLYPDLDVDFIAACMQLGISAPNTRFVSSDTIKCNMYCGFIVDDLKCQQYAGLRVEYGDKLITSAEIVSQSPIAARDFIVALRHAEHWWLNNGGSAHCSNVTDIDSLMQPLIAAGLSGETVYVLQPVL